VSVRVPSPHAASSTTELAMAIDTRSGLMMDAVWWCGLVIRNAELSRPCVYIGHRAVLHAPCEASGAGGGCVARAKSPVSASGAIVGQV
jgi:hypothetical protein